MINEDTCAALAEYEEMKVNPEAYKRYVSFDDAMNEVLADGLQDHVSSGQ